jgi:pimeloyl-ACP methyl ester carboxylesterase
MINLRRDTKQNRFTPTLSLPPLNHVGTMRALTFALLIAVACVCVAQPIQSDTAREKRWAAEITPAILVGDATYIALESGHKFLSIYAANPKARAAVIVVHGMGVHPDWGLNNPLRSQLAEQGYATLSIQMPVLASDAKAEQYPALFPAAGKRLQAAIAFLREKGHGKIAIVSHSMGSRMVNEFLARGGDVDAWVSVGISTGIFKESERFKAPVLDIFGEKDFPVVLQNAATRADAIRRVRGSSQIEVAGAGHYFNGSEAELVRHVKRFLDRATR